MSKSFWLSAVSVAGLCLSACATPARPGDSQVRSADLSECNTGSAIESVRRTPSSPGQPVDPRCRPDERAVLWSTDRGRDSEVPDFRRKSGDESGGDD